VFLKAIDEEGKEYYVEPGKLKDNFDKICKKYGLTSDENAGKLADLLCDSEHKSVSPNEVGQMFGMTKKDAFAFLQWINVGISFKEQVMDPSAKEFDL
jgi:hypothetical protein